MTHSVQLKMYLKWASPLHQTSDDDDDFLSYQFFISFLTFVFRLWTSAYIIHNNHYNDEDSHHSRWILIYDFISGEYFTQVFYTFLWREHNNNSSFFRENDDDDGDDVNDSHTK